MPRSKFKSVEQRKKQRAMKRNITQLTPEAAEAQRSYKRTYMQKKRSMETQEATDKRLAAVREHTQKRRKEETPDATNKRLAAVREHTQKRRKEETPYATNKRLAADREHTQTRRKVETPDATNRRLAAFREHMQKRRKEETPDATNRRLAAVRAKMQQHRKYEQGNEITINKCATNFLTKVAEGPIYACVSCCRLLYRGTVLEMKVGNYSQNQITEKILKFGQNIKTNGKSWICRTCHTALKQGNVPTQSWLNDMALDDIPDELNDLRPLELRLISQRLAFMKLVGLPRGGQKAIHGSAVNVPSKLQPVVSLLPRLPETAEVVAFKLKRKLCFKGHHMYEYIRPQCVMKGLQWLQQNNPLYRDVSICDDWESQWKETEGPLWEALTSNVADNIEQGENTVCDRSTHTTGCNLDGTLTACPASVTPSALDANYDTILQRDQATDDERLSTDSGYMVLRHLARKRNLKIINVAGDGDCFFHAVSVSLPAAGVQTIPGPEIRTQLIQYLETAEAEELFSGFPDLTNAQVATTCDTLREQQHQQYLSYISDLRNGKWADNVAVQAVANMFNINIKVVNTITPDWLVNIQPLEQTSQNTITLGQIGEHHYVAMQNVDGNEGSQAESTIQRMEVEDEEDRIAFEQTSNLRGIPYETLLQEEQVADGDNIFSLAPGENQTPFPFLADDRFEELANPSKYPFGSGGLGDTDKRQRKITAKRYFNQRILHMDGRFAKDIEYLLTAQYITEAKQVSDSIQINLRQTRGQTFQNKIVNAGLMKNTVNVQAMLRTDNAYKFMKNIRGSPAFWNSVLLDLLAMVRQLGIPTWFLTLSAADMQWPEVIRSIAHQYGTYLTDDDVKKMSWEEKCKWLRSNPVTAARQFDHRLNLFFKEYIGGKGHPIGELQDYMIRIEFQARGSPHAHTILWMKNAPKLGVDEDAEVINFINEHQSCAIPDNSDEDMRDLVLSRQKHVHSKTCRRAGSCRFKFPHPPSMETIIARRPSDMNPAAVATELKTKEDVLRKVRTIMEDKTTPQDISLEHLLRRAKVHPQEYQQALKLTKSREQIILRRNPSETDINQYNPKILKLWRANMDLQFILDPYSCIMYITSYMLKSERAMSDLLQKVLEESRGEDLKSKLRKVGSAFLNNREVSAQEAVYRLLSLPLQRKSRQVVYVNTATKDKRVSMLKPRHVLESMNDDDDDIFCTSALDRYASRPRVLEEMSLAEFRATYNTGASDPPDGGTDHIPDVLDGRDDNGMNDKDRIQRYPRVIKLQNNLGNMKRRRQHCIIRFHKETKNDEDRYRNLLMLYLPWRDEEVDLKDGFASYKDHFEHVIDTVRANEAMFSINADAIDAAYNDLLRNGPPEDIWHSIAPNVEFEQAEQQAEGLTVGGEMSEEDQRENIDLTPQSTSNHRSELHARFTAELNKVRMSSEEYRTMMRSLNSKQMEVLRFHRKWCKDTIIALKHDKPAPQYTIFLSGPGGVGKSHIIKLVHHETLRLLTPLSGRYFDPNDLPVLLTAFTGTAAFGINGMTLHSALSLGCGGKEYQPLSSDKLNTLRSRLGKLKLLIVDEVSMVGADILYHVHRRLQDICGNSDPDTRFGGVSILAVGDLFQLQPVGQRHVFSEPSSDYAKLHAKIKGSLWVENFRMVELTESMRQKEDLDFANLLMRVRRAACTESDINILKSRVISKADPYPSEALHVFRNNKEADDHNLQHLTKLSSKVFHIKAIDTKKDLRTGLTNVAISTKSSGHCALREVLSVAVGARVMVTVNVDVSDGIVNGAFATVVAIDSTGLDVQTILVKFDSDWVGQQAIANSQYKLAYPGVVPIQKQNIQVSPNSGRRSVQVQRTQFPLSLAWACTIHKVQGKTLDKIVVSTEGRGRCFPGQAYVALSRVKSLNGLHLLRFEASAISVDLDVLKEMDRLQQELVPMGLQPSSITSQDTCLNIKLLNIRSYLEHLQDLKADSSTHPVDVFCFVETFLYRNQQIEPFPPQAQAFRADRAGRGGGVMTVAKQDLSPTQLRIAVSGLEYTATTITKASTTVNIINVYRSQSLKEDVFIDSIQRLLDLLPSDILTVVLGDFNFDLLKCPPPKILAAMGQFGFSQHVQVPTTDNGTLLDHVYVRGHVEDNVHVTVVDTYYSDHDMVCVSLKL
ncbi:uncharacterized protein [Branchiostoma lanceolatum]|uniref:uncharacterized protein isoform X1 n=1 Tax=Branchiostoma lanceolatum TaxID=7740 RepID=UPI003452A0E7